MEVESIAYVVCQHFGIFTSEYYFGYVASWSRNKQMNELKSSLDQMCSTTGEIIAALDDTCIVHTQVKKQTYSTIRKIGGNPLNRIIANLHLPPHMTVLGIPALITLHKVSRSTVNLDIYCYEPKGNVNTPEYHMIVADEFPHTEYVGLARCSWNGYTSLGCCPETLKKPRAINNTLRQNLM